MSHASSQKTTLKIKTQQEIQTKVRQRNKRAIHNIAAFSPAILLAVLFLAGWQIYTARSEISPTVLPSPARVLRTLQKHAPLLLSHTKTTLVETLLGFGLAMLTAAILALALDGWQWLARALYPWLVASQTIPIVALAPLMLVWFGFGLLPKILLVALFCFFPIVVATVDGLAATDPDLRKLMTAMGAGYWQTLRLVRFPDALPSIFSGLKIAVTYSVTAAIFAEYAGGISGLGILMQSSAQSRATPLVFAGIVVTSIASFILFFLINIIERLTVRWKSTE